MNSLMNLRPARRRRRITTHPPFARFRMEPPGKKSSEFSSPCKPLRRALEDSECQHLPASRRRRRAPESAAQGGLARWSRVAGGRGLLHLPGPSSSRRNGSAVLPWAVLHHLYTQRSPPSTEHDTHLQTWNPVEAAEPGEGCTPPS